MTELSDFGNIIKKTLGDMGLQQSDLAERINKQEHYISKLLRQTNPTTNTLLSIANALDCSVDYLLGRTDNPQAHRDETILTDRERVLVAQYRGLNEQGREMLIGQASLLAGSSQYSIKSDEKPLTVASSDNK